MNIRKGLFRLWLVISLPWMAFFCWHGYSSYDRQKYWQQSGSEWYEKMNLAASEAEKAPLIHEGGLDRAYYKSQYDYYREQFMESVSYRDEAKDGLETATFYGPLLPGVLILGYLAVNFVIRGFFLPVRAGKKPE